MGFLGTDKIDKSTKVEKVTEKIFKSVTKINNTCFSSTSVNQDMTIKVDGSDFLKACEEYNNSLFENIAKIEEDNKKLGDDNSKQDVTDEIFKQNSSAIEQNNEMIDVIMNTLMNKCETAEKISIKELEQSVNVTANSTCKFDDDSLTSMKSEIEGGIKETITDESTSLGTAVTDITSVFRPDKNIDESKDYSLKTIINEEITKDFVNKVHSNMLLNQKMIVEFKGGANEVDVQKLKQQADLKIVTEALGKDSSIIKGMTKLDESIDLKRTTKTNLVSNMDTGAIVMWIVIVAVCMAIAGFVYLKLKKKPNR